MDVQHEEEQFQYWLADMDDALERFLKSLPPETRSKLDYSIESLDAVEDWILEKYGSTAEMLDPKESRTVDGLARYIGETIRRNVGGHWEIRLDDPKYAYYGIPQITGYSPHPTPEAPATLATAAADRRTGNFISGVVRTMK